jgi:haloacetate dehalogenase
MSDRNSEEQVNIGRRTQLKNAMAVAVSAALGGVADAQDQAADTTRFFPGFTQSQIKVSGATINTLKGGSGPPLLLLHGAPQSHISWRLVAPEFAKHYTVIVTDLRGYGDSSTPDGGEDHMYYSKRAMAFDQVEVMRQFGYKKFSVIGHDRGGRVAHRMALDYRDVVTKLAVIDIVPTHYLYTHVTIEFVQAYFHWFNYLRAAPGPENDLLAQAETRRANVKGEIPLEYFRTTSRPANIHAMCEDYRAGASIDLKHDAADLHKKIKCPLLAIWGDRAPMGRIYNVVSVWKERAVNVRGKGLPAGHTVQEDAPEQFVKELLAFLA